MNWQALRRRDRRALVIGLVAITVMIVGYRGFPAWRSWRAEARVSARESLMRAAHMEMVLADFPRSLDTLEARTGRLLQHTPAFLAGATRAASASVLMAVVRTMARESSLRLDGVEVQQDTSTTHALPHVAIEAWGTTDVVGLASFLERIERGPTLLAVRHLHVQPQRVGVPSHQVEILHVRLTVEGLALLSDQSGGRNR